MFMIKVIFPRGDDVYNHFISSLETIREMESCFNKKEKIVLDLSEVQWFLPCSIIMISNKITELVDNGAEFDYSPPEKLDVREHLKKVGFPLGDKEEGGSYVPISHFKKRKGDKNQVNREFNYLMNKIEGKIPSKFGESINYILGELSDNIDTHSEFSCASIMAQYFPTKKKVDVVVFDNGITIPGLFERHNIPFKNDSDAINKAICGEVTTKKDEFMRGYGLKSCKRLSTEGTKGELYIISRGGIMILKSNKDPLLYNLDKKMLNGTLLYFRLEIPKKKLNIHDFLN